MQPVEVQAARIEIQQQQRNAVLKQVLQLIREGISLARLFATIVPLLTDVFAESYCCFLQHNEQDDQFRVVAPECYSQEWRDRIDDFCQQQEATLAIGQPIVTTNLLVIPVLQTDPAYLIALYSPSARSWTVDDIEFGQMIADCVAIAVQQVHHQQTEESLRKTQNLLQSTVDAAPGIIFIKDAQERYLLVNRAWEEFWGIDRSQAIGRSAFELFPPQISDLFHQKNQTIFQSGQPDQYEETMPVSSKRTWLTTKFLVHDPDGHSLAMSGFCFDITDLKRTEAALQQSEARFRVALQDSHITVFNQDTDLRYTWIYNPKAIAEPSTVLGKTDADFANAEDAAFLTNLKRQVLTSGIGIRREIYIHINGEKTFFDLTIEPLHNQAGEISGITCAATDITDRKKAEFALRESEERFRAIFEQAAVGITLTDSKSGRYLKCNDRFCQMFGYTEAELLERTWQDTTHPDDLEISILEDERLLNGEIANLSMEKRYLHKSGMPHWVKVTVSPLYNLSGVPTYEICVVEDIQIRKQTEQELLLYADVVKNVQIGIVVWQLQEWNDPSSFRLVMANPAVKEITGINLEPLIGVTIAEQFPDLLQTSLPQKYLEVLHTKQPTDLGEIYYENDGISPGIYSIKAFPLPKNCVGLSIDNITTRKQTEIQLQASLREKEVLLKEVHHRVKNNLQIISSLLDLQAQFLENHSAREAFRSSQNRVRSMALLHEKLYQSPNLAQINLADYIHSLMTDLIESYIIDPSPITLHLNIAPVHLSLDTIIPLGLLINELVSNALKHSFSTYTHGNLWIDLSAIDSASATNQPHDSQYKLIVGNDGTKFPDEFNWQTAKSLGLQLIYAWVQQLKGQIEVDRSRGTEFMIIFSERNP
jgi:PAS domain S-box-containing protein